MTSLIIVNRRPGMIRGGRQHPPVVAYSAEEAAGFTAEQLADIAGEPEMTLLVGDIVTPERASEVAESIAAEAARVAAAIGKKK